MVSLRYFVTGAIALVAATVNAAATPQQIADGINSITQKSSALQGTAQSISVLNAPLIIIGQGPFPMLIAGFTDIVSTATALADQMGAATKRRRGMAIAGMAKRGPDDDLVFNSYRAMVDVNQALLNILIGKAGTIEKVPVVGPPVAAVLRSFEAIIDTISITLINTFESRAKDLTSAANSLDATLTLAIQKYDGLQI
ncbi:hypothetical protein C8A05DRAFT_47201 [Staphylotrichum tortipilum]|uniref:Uncharacterized protein n=1 Tax=Staphylotrichum tortipilum TaxID=2831512 RepID=A0AAN6MCY9_9PEZI|nr:hypothetical protein C8A05DRAFT_47201 [Staphylotrichum longicolle]